MDIKNTIRALIAGKPFRSKTLAPGESWSDMQCWVKATTNETFYLNDSSGEKLSQKALKDLSEKEMRENELNQMRTEKIIWLETDLAFVRIATRCDVPENAPPFSELQSEKILDLLHRK